MIVKWNLPRYLRQDQVRAFFSVIRNPRDKALFTTIYLVRAVLPRPPSSGSVSARFTSFTARSFRDRTCRRGAPLQKSSDERFEGELRFDPRKHVRRYAEKYARRNVPQLFGEFLSVRHPEYPELERMFMVMESLPRRIDKSVRVLRTKHSRLVLEVFALEHLTPRLDELREMVRELEQGDRERGVLEVLKAMGPEALRPGEWERLRPWESCQPPVSVAVRKSKEEELSLLGRIRSLIWQALDVWHWDARHAATRGQRRVAQTAWRKVGRIMGGDLRGIRSNDILDVGAVCETYYTRLFRLLRALQLLEVWPWGGSIVSRILLVSEACGLSQIEFRRFLQLDSLGRRRDQAGRQAARSLPPEQAARIFTASEFKTNENRVSNILSGYWESDSRK